MKRFMVLFLSAMLLAGTSMAKDRVSRDENVLPPDALTLIKNNFKKTGINHIKIDTDVLGNKDYEVILNDGTELDFNKKGELKEIDCGSKAVPDNLILKPIRDFVKKNYPKSKIVTLEINKSNYEVELNSGQELKFDRAGKFLRVD